MPEESPKPGVSPVEQSYDCVLIDDDDLVRITWRMAAERAGCKLLALASAEAFWTHAPRLNREIPIYIDCRLEQGSSGQHLAQTLHAAGFGHLYIETGYDAAEVAPSVRRLLKGILGKHPPWR